MSEKNWFDNDMEDVEPVVEAETYFLRTVETLNPKRIMACWSESERITMLFPGTGFAQGPRAIEEAWSTVARSTSNLRLVLKPVNLMRLGDLAWTFLSGSMVSTHGDETLTVDVYMTNVYRRERGGWKLLHHHTAPAPHQPTFLEQRLN